MLKSLINRLKKKEFRDAYIFSHLTNGLAYQIRELRIKQGWTQKELSKRMGLKGQSAIARMEDPSYGKLSITTLIKLSSIFDVALTVRFQSYSKFLLEREDLSPAALSAENFESEIPKITESMDNIVMYSKAIIKSNHVNLYNTPIKILSQDTIYNDICVGTKETNDYYH